MATGIPKTQSNGIGQSHTDSELPSDIVLQYEGKQTSDETLKGARGEHVCVWPVTSDGTYSASPNRLYLRREPFSAALTA